MSPAPMTAEQVLAALRAASEALAIASIAHQQLAESGALSLGPRLFREIETNILEAAPLPDAEPVGRAELARRAGYYCGPYFRKAVNDLIDGGYLVEDRRTRRLKR